MKYYIAMHKTDWTEEDIEGMIHSIDVKRHYSPQTYWEPGEDYIDYEIELDNDFWKVVKIVEFSYYDDNENPFDVVIDDNIYCLGEKEGWEDVLQSLGWSFFENFDMKKDFNDAKNDVEFWIDKVAELEAWEYIENEQYGDY